MDAPVQRIILPVTSCAALDLVLLTPKLEKLVTDAHITDGRLDVYNQHTTSGILPEALADVDECRTYLSGLKLLEDERGHHADLKRIIQDLFERMAHPNAYYAHDDLTKRTQNLTPGERRNGWSHLWAAFCAQELRVPIHDGKLGLGRWQNVFYIDCDGPRERQLLVDVFKYDPAHATNY
jgi:thiamine phosphate synthase YjbQ (UPF0047 family)